MKVIEEVKKEKNSQQFLNLNQGQLAISTVLNLA